MKKKETIFTITLLDYSLLPTCPSPISPFIQSFLHRDSNSRPLVCQTSVLTTTPQLPSLVKGKVDVSVSQVTSNQLQILAVTFSADNCNFSNPCK